MSRHSLKLLRQAIFWYTWEGSEIEYAHNKTSAAVGARARGRGALAPPNILARYFSNSDVTEIMTSSSLQWAPPIFFAGALFLYTYAT